MSQRVLDFLLGNPDHAYTRTDIAESIDANPETVGTALSRLKERRLVRHRQPYWALTDDRGHLLESLDAPVGGDTPAGNVNSSRETGVDGAAAASHARRDDPTSRGSHLDAAGAFFQRARDELEAAVDTCYLFGSVARGDETAASDVDVLVVIADDAEFASVDDRLLDVAYDVQLEHHVPIDVHSIRASEFAARKDRGEPFVRAVLSEGHERAC